MLVEFSIYPLEEKHLSGHIARMVEILDESGLNYRVGPTSTCLEGEWDEVLSTIRRCHESVSNGKSSRVITSISIDDHGDASHTLEEAVARVEEQLGRPVASCT